MSLRFLFVAVAVLAAACAPGAHGVRTVPLTRKVKSFEQRLALRALRAQQSADAAELSLADVKSGPLPPIPVKNLEDAEYYGPVAMGTPSQTGFTAIYDTGSATLWVPSSTCKSPSCKIHHTFNSASSSSFVKDGRLLFLPYGSGIVLGVMGNDTCSFGGADIRGQVFGMVTVEPGEIWVESPFDGILGLGWPQLALPAGVPPPFNQMFAEGLVDEEVFSFYLSSTENDTSSALVLGGVDSQYYTGDIQYFKQPLIQAALGYWLLVGDFAVNGTSVKNANLIVDTGTSILTVPPAQKDKILGVIGTVAADCSNAADKPDIEITLGGTVFSLGQEFYVLRNADSSGKIQCSLGIEALNVGLPNFWILGDPFLRKYYSVFDFAQNRIGFATAVAQ